MVEYTFEFIAFVAKAVFVENESSDIMMGDFIL